MIYMLLIKIFTTIKIEQIEDEFNRTLNEFEHVEPFNRPLLPKQQSSKKFFAMIAILNQLILPKFVNNTKSFKKLHSVTSIQ
jgi:hypothetical protein